MKRTAFALLLALPILSCRQSEQMQVNSAWTRDTIGRTASAAVFMTITSPTPDRLVGASTEVAAKADLMTMQSGGSGMGMAYLKSINIPAGTPVRLNPAGLHVWLADLHRPLRAGQSFPLTLRFEEVGERRVDVSVIAPAGAPPAAE